MIDMPQLTKRVTMIELFYDLVFAYMISQATSLIHHLSHGTVSPISFLIFAVVVIVFINSWMVQSVLPIDLAHQAGRILPFTLLIWWFYSTWQIHLAIPVPKIWLHSLWLLVFYHSPYFYSIWLFISKQIIKPIKISPKFSVKFCYLELWLYWLVVFQMLVGPD